MFVYVHIISLHIHVLLCEDGPIGRGHMTDHNHTFHLMFFSVLSIIFILIITINP